MLRPSCYLMPCKHVDNDFIFPEAKNRKYQVILVIKFGLVEVAASELFPQSRQLKSWSEVCDISPQCETLAKK